MKEPREFKEIVKLRHMINELNHDPVVEEILDQIEYKLHGIWLKMNLLNEQCEYLEQRETDLEDEIETLKCEVEEAECRFNHNRVIEWLCMKLEERDFSDSNCDSCSRLTKEQWKEEALNAAGPLGYRCSFD